MKDPNIDIIEAIELGLNLIAQNLLFESSQDDIDAYINNFKFSKYIGGK